MFEWINHLITDVIGGYIGAVMNSKFGQEVIQRVSKKLDENHRECFFRVLNTIDIRYQKILRDRLQEAARFNRETWAVNLIGKFLESVPKEIPYAAESSLELFALERHFEGLHLTEKQLRQAWLHPEHGARSEFLFSIYLLEDDKIPQFTRRLFGGASFLSRRVNRRVNQTLKPLNNEIESQIQQHKSRWGRI